MVFLLPVQIKAADPTVTPNAQTQRPFFFQPGEKVRKKINNRVYVSEGEGDRRGGRSRSEIKRLYFTDASGRLIRDVEVFPKTAKRNTSVEVKHGRKYLWLSRSYGTDSKTIRDFVFFDMEGKKVWETPWDKDQLVFVNDEKEKILMVHPNSAELKVFSMGGGLLSSKKFSEQVVENIRLETEAEGEEEGVSSSLMTSTEAGHFALSRTFRNSNGFSPELLVFDLEGDVVMIRSFPEVKGRFLIPPIFVSDEARVVICLNTSVVGTKKSYKVLENYVAFDYSGKKIWEIDAKDHHLDTDEPLSGGQFLNIKNNKTGRISRLEVKSGRIQQ